MRPLLARLRDHGEARSIGRAICALFLLTGLISAFASGVAAAQAVDGGDGIVHCLSGLVDYEGEFDDAANCCTLSCPMVAAALPTPTGPGVIDADLAARDLAPLRPIAVLNAGPCRDGSDGPRGPPPLV